MGDFGAACSLFAATGSHSFSALGGGVAAATSIVIRCEKPALLQNSPCLSLLSYTHYAALISSSAEWLRQLLDSGCGVGDP